jgi:LPS export ABC transporter protein LptC
VRHNLTQDGIRRAVLNSDTAYAYEDTRELDLVGVDVTFYDEAGRVAGTLTSETGEYNLAEGLFVARDSVVLVTDGPDGERRLTSPELFFDVRTDRIWSDRPFTLVENGRTSRGQTFRSDSRFETWQVTGIQTTGTVDADEGLTF